MRSRTEMLVGLGIAAFAIAYATLLLVVLPHAARDHRPDPVPASTSSVGATGLPGSAVGSTGAP